MSCWHDTQSEENYEKSVKASGSEDWSHNGFIVQADFSPVNNSEFERIIKNLATDFTDYTNGCCVDDSLELILTPDP